MFVSSDIKLREILHTLEKNADHTFPKIEYDHANSWTEPNIVFDGIDSGAGDASILMEPISLAENEMNKGDGHRIGNGSQSTIKSNRASDEEDFDYGNDNGEDTSDTDTEEQKCTMCPRTFQTPAGLQRHKMAKHKRKMEAGKRNNGTNDDDKVPKVEPRENKYQCPDCPKIFETNSGLRKHKIGHHQGQTGQTKEKPVARTREIDSSAEKNLRKCWDCDKTFETLSGLRKHRINIHKTNPESVTFKCQWCSKSFYSKGGLKKHKANAHPEQPGTVPMEPEVPPFRWKCGACGETFKTRKTMHDHRMFTGHKAPRKPTTRTKVSRETGLQGDFSCDICGRAYTTKRKIRHHMETHDSEKKKQKFLCTVCGIWLSSNHILESHYRAIHLGEKRYKCPYCDRLFSFRQDLKVHTNRHEGIRPYACKLCPKTFFLSSNLKEHMESIHLNEKRHICTICGKAFNRRGNLKLHTFTHTRQAQHQCTQCGAGFGRKYKLTEHIEICPRKKVEVSEVVSVTPSHDIILMSMNPF